MEEATMANRLSDAQIDEALSNLDGWARESETIVRAFEFPDFVAALGFITRVGLLAERANHHPEIHNVYNRVRIALSTHDAGGITEQDASLAREIDAHN
jgi:4a-hydroxytetrahydrobiopterin dehydratase